MIKKAYLRFKDFLLTFNYSNKVRFIIFLVIYCAICVEIMQLQYHNSILDQLELHKKGGRYFLQLITLTNHFMQYDTLNEKAQIEKKILENEIDNFFSTKIQHSSFFPKNLIKTEELLNLDTHLNIGDGYWKSLKDNPAKKDTILAFAETLKDIYLSATKVYHLDTNFDASNYFLSQIFTFRIPNIQNFLYQLRFFDQVESQENALKGVKLDLLLYQLKNEEETIRNYYELAYLANKLLQRTIPIHQNIEVLNFSRQINQIIELMEHSAHENQQIEKIDQAISQSLAIQTGVLDNFVTLNEAQTNIIYWRRLLSTIYVCSGPFIVLAFYMTRIIRRPIADLIQAAEKLSKGDLTVRIPIETRDEVSAVAEGFNKMLNFFEKIMRQAENISSVLFTSTSAIFSNSKELESNVVEQEKAIKQILHNSKGITKSVQDFGDFLKQANQSALVTTKLANTGKAALDYMDTVMHLIESASERMVNTLNQLQNKIGTIQTIINTIVKIADQINLLSLNSAIRAGKEAKQFPGHAVIADKIRELADQTAFVTLDMEQSIKDILMSVEETALSVVEFSSKIQELMQDGTQIQERLKAIIGFTKTQVDSFESTYEDMQEQINRVSKIEEAIHQLTTNAQKTTTSIRNLYIEIEYLYHSTNNLQTMTKQFLQSSAPSSQISFDSLRQEDWKKID